MLAMAAISDVDLFVEEVGSGEPLVLVHGAWGDHFEWAFVQPMLAERCRVIVYDRRGHSASGPAVGSVADDVADLANLIENRVGGPAFVYGSSFGGILALRLAATRPDLVRAVCAHEPPAFGILPRGKVDEPGDIDGVLQLIREGRHEDAARTFVEDVVFGPGAWAFLPAEARDTFTRNAPTFLEEREDPECDLVDLDALARDGVPVHLTVGTASPAAFGQVVERIHQVVPRATTEAFSEAGHVPHVTHTDQFVASVLKWLASGGQT